MVAYEAREAISIMLDLRVQGRNVGFYSESDGKNGSPLEGFELGGDMT